MRLAMDRQCGWTFLVGVLAAFPGKSQPTLFCGVGLTPFVAPADVPVPLTMAVGINVAPGAANVSVNLSKQTPDKPGGPTFLVASPSSGVTPTTVYIGLDPNVVPYLPAGAYGQGLTFAPVGSSSPSTGCGILVSLRLTSPGLPSVTSVVSSATLQPAISPGELVSIFGENIGTPPVYGHFDPTGLYPTMLGNKTVTFNGVVAPLLYVSNTQINAVVPYEVAGQKSVSVVVAHFPGLAPAFSVPIMDTSPGVFSSTQTGTGQGVIINASDPSGLLVFNSRSNPAPSGSVITFIC